MLTIYDAVAWETMPPGKPILVYEDGNFPTYPAAVNGLHPPLFWTVTTTGKNVADIADCEGGDLSPAQAVFGLRLGFWHTIYCSLSTFPHVVAEAKAQGSPRWSWFAADPTGTPHLPKGAAACQYAWHSLGQCPANYDMSIATEAWVNMTHGPQPLPQPTLGDVDIMGITQMSNGELAIDAIGRDGSPSAGHQLVFVVNPVGQTTEVIDATDGAGAHGPGNSLYTVQP